jgi:hypothetical protein
MNQDGRDIDYLATMQNILKSIHRIRVMLWAFDYDAAQIEMAELESKHYAFLNLGSLAEKSFFEARQDIKNNNLEEILKSELANSKLKKYQREYLLELKTTHQIAGRLETSFRANFRISPISRTIAQLKKKLEDRPSSMTISQLDNYSQEEIEIHRLSKYFFKRIPLGYDHVEYRAYNLNTLPIKQGGQIVEQLKQVFGVTPSIKGGYYEGVELPLPLQVKLFILGAMIQVTVHDNEHFAVEIMFSQDIQPKEEFDKVYNIITQFIPPQG